MSDIKNFLKENFKIENKIPKKVLKKWLKALRSDEYLQTQGTLYNADADDKGNPGFCCLGVLEHCLSGGVEWREFTPKSLPSREFLQDYGISFLHNNHKMYEPSFVYKDLLREASNLNDHFRLSFAEIADIIEQQVIAI